MSYGNILKEARRKAKMTQEALAIKVGCTRTTICDWETEKYPPTDARNIAALETTLSFKHGELFSLIYSNPTPPSGAEEASPRA